MKALSLLQPYATLIMLGYKQYETRSWNTRHRGYLGIHASLGKPEWARDVCENNKYIQEALQRHGLTFDTLPRGVLLGTCELVDTLAIVGCGSAAGLQRVGSGEYQVPAFGLSEMEVAAGDYADKRFAWKLEQIAAVAQPVPCTGALSLWRIPEEAYHDVEAQLYVGPGPARENSYWEMPPAKKPRP
ncbi:ASCH domain-containing protein [Hymenobacter sp. BT728]|nr:ASCH domain-containing protein [Hymenobacter pini]